MEKVAIVILNYLNYKDTIECIESIKNQTYGNLETIVVENGSTNESWKLIEDKYKGIEKIFKNSVKAQKFINILATIGTFVMILFLFLLRTNQLWIRYQ